MQIKKYSLSDGKSLKLYNEHNRPKSHPIYTARFRQTGLSDGLEKGPTATPWLTTDRPIR